MGLSLVPAYEYPREVAALFTEYTDTLIAGDPEFRKYLNKQNYEQEVKHLEVKYGQPYGRLYLAHWDGNIAGCIGLRKIDQHNCEMKRLYVRPEFQGKGIGRALAQKVIADAREIGYSSMLLDTLPFLQTAIDMYKSMGFYEIPSYNNSPMEGLVYLKLEL